MTTFPLSLLVIDDSEATYRLICDFLAALHRSRYEPTWAPTFDTGLKQLLRKTYDVCLVDYELGPHTGLNLIKDAIAAGVPTPMILLTGYGNRQVDMQAMEAGAFDYLDKTGLRPDTLERSLRYAIRQAQALHAEHQQRILAEALLDVAAALNSTLKFDEVLERILTNVGAVIPHDTANIMLIENGFTRVVGSKGYETAEFQQEIFASRFDINRVRSFRHLVATRQPLVIPDLLNASNWLKHLGPHRLRGYLGAPILLGEQVIGLINLECYSVDFFTSDHARRLQLFAGQAALAIQNAFAYQRAHEHAAQEERQRLARDLHDAVSQTLFSASVIAETLPRLMPVDPEEVKRGLTRLAQLTRGALAEMRSLLVELRPTALIEMDLSILLRQLITGLQSRTDIEFLLEMQGTEWALPEATHISFYRIAQEGLNNTIKHSRATRVTVLLTFAPTSVQLTLTDNGIGFDRQTVSSERMGLRIMQERAEDTCITLTISSQPDHGTIVQAYWQSSRATGELQEE